MSLVCPKGEPRTPRVAIIDRKANGPARPWAVDEAVCRLFAPVAQAGDFRIDLFVGDELPHVHIALADLEQLLVCLVQNALDACLLSKP
ncbi:MAG TPA: hypothetical protein VGZ22_02670 [Isosphaeraceae bacterium]|nr:hypothetical protein [Isosphaeraceae bacterium]